MLSQFQYYESFRNFKKKSLFASRKVGNEMVLVPLKNNIANMNELFTLNEVGSFIWNLIDGENSEADIIEAIADSFDIDFQTAKQDFDNFMLDLASII